MDFTDLIVGATALCNANGGGNYDCIIVDEFQDISMDRYNFLLALRRGNPQAQLYCVGDDWQSIYRFSGSDMNLFCHFDQYFGKTDLNKIETTYRFGNPLVEKSAAFIQRNPAQIRKNIHPFSSDAKTEIVFREYSRGGEMPWALLSELWRRFLWESPCFCLDDTLMTIICWLKTSGRDVVAILFFIRFADVRWSFLPCIVRKAWRLTMWCC